MSLDKVNSGEKFSEKYVGNIENKLEQREQAFLKKYRLKKETLEQLHTFHAQALTEELNAVVREIAQKESLKEESEITALNDNVKEILHTIDSAKRDRELLSQEILKEKINNSIITEENSFLAKYVPKEILQKINDPKDILDELIAGGFTLGESIFWTGKLTADIIAGIFYLPRDIIAFARGKADFETNIEV